MNSNSTTDLHGVSVDDLTDTTTVCTNLPPVPAMPEWPALINSVTFVTHGIALGPFAKYCMEREIAPNAVSDALMLEYLNHLAVRRRLQWPRRTAQLVVRAWNAQIGRTPGWPEAKLNRAVGGQ